MMMAKRREERYASCRQIIEDLERLSHGLPTHYAQAHLGQDVMATLAKGQEQPLPPRDSGVGGGTPAWLTTTLGALAAISVLINILLAAALAQR
jgi:hypothetical protein